MNHTHDDLLSTKELAELQKQFGQFPHTQHRIEMGATSLETYRRQLKRRRGEILLVLTRPSGDVLLHTKHFYPAGIYRLPTGGINWDEPIVDAWHRELWEETQLRSAGETFLGIVSYEFYGPGPCVPFVSYLFQLDNVTTEPVPLDEDEGISDFRWAPRTALAEVAAQLGDLDRIDREKGDWGRFRAVAHEIVRTANG